jgi:hypothetical protein
MTELLVAAFLAGQAPDAVVQHAPQRMFPRRASLVAVQPLEDHQRQRADRPGDGLAHRRDGPVLLAGLAGDDLPGQADLRQAAPEPRVVEVRPLRLEPRRRRQRRHHALQKPHLRP